MESSKRLKEVTSMSAAMPWPCLLQVLVLLGCVVIATPLFSCRHSGKPVDVILAFSDSRSTMWQWWTGVLFNPAVSNFVHSLLAHLDYTQYRVLGNQAYREDHIQFLGVGYRNFFIRPQLEALTGDPRAVFFVEQDFGLWLVIRLILDAICDTWSQIVLVVDDSESTRRFQGLDYFQAPGVGDFLSAFAEDLDTASCHTGLLLFSDSARQLCPITSNATRLQGCVRSVPDYLEFGGSVTSEGLRSARNLLTSQGDPDTRKFVIVLTDGCSENSVATAAESQRLLDMNVEVMAVGYPNPTGASQDQGELETIAGDRGRVYRVASDSNLPSLVGELYRRVCPPSSF